MSATTDTNAGDIPHVHTLEYPPKPCPTCGTCPTCGRGFHFYIPYQFPQWPVQPIITCNT